MIAIPDEPVQRFTLYSVPWSSYEPYCMRWTVAAYASPSTAGDWRS